MARVRATSTGLQPLLLLPELAATVCRGRMPCRAVPRRENGAFATISLEREFPVGWRIVLKSDHADCPARLGVISTSASAKFWLEQVSLARNIGFTAQQLGELHALVRQHRDALLEAWYGHFGGNR